MHRFFIPPECVQGSTATLDDPAQLHHLRQVLRLTVGNRIVCFDGQGRAYHGTIRRHTPTSCVIELGEPIVRAQTTVTLWLAPALLKAERFDWLVQKATELGVWRLSPLITRHTIVRLTPEQRRSKHSRWQRIAREAAKQSQRSTLPVVDEPQPFDAFVPSLAGAPLVMIPTLAVTAIPLREVLKTVTPNRQAAVLIGPEGDFTHAEVALAERYGARPVSLGPLTLRAETAALASLAMLQYALDA